LRPFDVQLVGGILLHEGKIAEMRTGEGKTLVATLPIYLNALERQGVHLVTVNDYLARRDARWMGPLFHLLGLSVGVLQEASRTENGRKAFVFDPSRESAQEDVHQLRLVDRAEAYGADVTYGTNNEFGFDYLRDNMAQSLDARVQRGHNYVIVDEVDNILIDEARTPLIISGPSHEDPEMYERVAAVVKGLVPEDFEVSERDRSVSLTELGEEHLERLFGTRLRDPDRPEDITPELARLLGFVEQAVRAEHLFKRNKDYVVQAGRVIIVDEFTGRLMAGRRWSDGLHQAVEAKEGVKVRQDNVTYATITLQNYFRKYAKLAGMTGTAVTEAEEFHKIYNVEVASLPTNLEYIARQQESGLVEASYEEEGQKYFFFTRRDDGEKSPVFWRRKDMPDLVYRTEEAKLRAVSLEILRRHVRGQPLLVGTTSVELSERLSQRLRAAALQDLAMVEVLRDAYLEKHSLPNDGSRSRRCSRCTPLWAQVVRLASDGRELGLPLNPGVRKPGSSGPPAGAGGRARANLEAALDAGIRHTVLNAKKHDEESAIIAGAGARGGHDRHQHGRARRRSSAGRRGGGGSAGGGQPHSAAGRHRSAGGPDDGRASRGRPPGPNLGRRHLRGGARPLFELRRGRGKGPPDRRAARPWVGAPRSAPY
jgi:preprotein translocase subunit SecA